jgi:REP element-mobilizing transposase RayT
LYKFGKATLTNERRSVAGDAHDSRLRLAAKQQLKFPPVRFDDAQRRLIAAGFARAVEEGRYIIHACCVGHDHTHLILKRHDRRIEAIARHLKSKATMALSRANRHPLGGKHSPWSEGEWSVFINDLEQLRAAIQYVERHPEKEGLPRQNWAFVTPLCV